MKTEGIRLASSAPMASSAPIPWKSPLVVLLRISDGTFWASHAVADKRRMLRQAEPGDLVLAAWTHEHRQDVFVVDDPATAAAVLGCSLDLTDAQVKFAHDNRETGKFTEAELAELFGTSLATVRRHLEPEAGPLLDPDCRQGKCGSCVGGPCEHDCHRRTERR
jgi:hypothetical protein